VFESTAILKKTTEFEPEPSWSKIFCFQIL